MEFETGIAIMVGAIFGIVFNISMTISKIEKHFVDFLHKMRVNHAENQASMDEILKSNNLAHARTVESLIQHDEHKTGE